MRSCIYSFRARSIGAGLSERVRSSARDYQIFERDAILARSRNENRGRLNDEHGQVMKGTLDDMISPHLRFMFEEPTSHICDLSVHTGAAR